MFKVKNKKHQNDVICSVPVADIEQVNVNWKYLRLDYLNICNEI